MKRRAESFYFLLSVSLCFLLPASCFLLTVAEAANRVVAVVNSDIITEWDVHVRMSALLEDGESLPDDEEQASEFRRAILGRLIEERLIIQAASRLGVAVEADEV